MARINRNIKRLGGYLLGDSDEYGKDQIISRDLKNPHPANNVANQMIICEAMAYARAHNYKNIRVEIITSYAVTIRQGIIGWKIASRKIVNFTDKVKDIFVCAS